MNDQVLKLTSQIFMFQNKNNWTFN